jgi:hypothetical protein
MKQSAIILFAIFGICNMALSQDSYVDDRSKFHFGVKAGTNFANVYDSQGDDFRADGKFGFVGGLFFTIPMGELMGFQPEILYSQKGFKATGRVLATTYELTRTKNYIDIPLYLAVKPIPQLTIMAGPQISYLLSQKDVFANASNSIEVIEEFNNEDIRKNLVGIIAGIDVNLSRVIFGAKAGWDLSTNHGDGTATTPRYKNAWIQATVGYRFL